MAFFTSSLSGLSISATNAFRSIQTTNTGVVRLHELFIGGEDTSSKASRFSCVRIVNANAGTANATITPIGTDPASVAAASTVNSGWSAGATIPAATSDILTPAFNTFGGQFRWVAPPEAYVVQTGTGSAPGHLFFVVRNGSSVAFSGHIVFEER